jgi:hypothetical protein
MKVLPPAAAPTDRRRVWGQTNAGGRRRQCAPAAPCGFVDGAKQRRPQLHRGNNRKKQSIPALVQPTQNSKEALFQKTQLEYIVPSARKAAGDKSSLTDHAAPHGPVSLMRTVTD